MLTIIDRLQRVEILLTLFLHTGFCIPRFANNSCYIGRGSATIFLDSDAQVAKVLAWRSIKAGLTNQTLLSSFDPTVVSAEYLRSISETLILLSSTESLGNDDSSPVPRGLFVAIAASLVSFLITAAFSYGVFRRQAKRAAEEERRNAKKKKHHRVSPFVAHAKRRHFFESLENEPEGVIHIPEVNGDEPSITWSVSDMTSDSGSVHSFISRTTSRLESIAEEDSEEEDEKDENPAAVADYTAAYAAHRSRLSKLIRETNFDSSFGELPDEKGNGTFGVFSMMNCLSGSSSYPSQKEDVTYGPGKAKEVIDMSKAEMTTTASPTQMDKPSPTGSRIVTPPDIERSATDPFNTSPGNVSTSDSFHTPEQQSDLDESEDSAPDQVIELPSAFYKFISEEDDHRVAITPPRSDDPRSSSLNDSPDTTGTDGSLKGWLKTLLLQLNMSEQPGEKLSP
jgi:hypothetical protein